MLVDALMKGKGKGKGKTTKGESKERKSKDDNGKNKGWKNRAKDTGDKSQDSPYWTREELLQAACECNADVSWSFCVPVDRVWICCHWLPA